MPERPTAVVDHFAIHPTAYVFPQVFMSGSVTIGADSSVWPMCVLRGDECAIMIGARSNVQDGCVIHGDPGYAVLIGDRVTIGHMAMIHGAVIEDEVLVGIGAVVLSGARIGRGSLIGARALVTEGMVVPPGSLVLGVPGTIRPLRPEQAARIAAGADEYVRLKQLYRERDTVRG